ncbi:transposase [Luedemannella flava]
MGGSGTGRGPCCEGPTAQDVEERAARDRARASWSRRPRRGGCRGGDEGGATASRRCAIPDEENHRPKWALAVEMLDALAAHGLRPPLLAADAGYGDN